MGMDVYGTNPVNETGEYFRNNVWWWRPLWDYCLTHHNQVAGKVEYGHSNDGDGLDATDARILGTLLRQDISSGFAAKFEKDYKEFLDATPKVDCTVCKKSGKVKYKNESGDSTESTCHNCEGTGLAADMITYYPFSVDNLKKFADFCYYSGGFQIC